MVDENEVVRYAACKGLAVSFWKSPDGTPWLSVRFRCKGKAQVICFSDVRSTSGAKRQIRHAEKAGWLDDYDQYLTDIMREIDPTYCFSGARAASAPQGS